MNRPRSIALLALVVASVLVTLPAPAIAAPGNNTTDAAADGEFTLRELNRGGRHPSAAPPSVRYLGDTGAVAIRYTPAAPLKSDQQYLEPGTTLHTDDIQLYSTRFGSAIDAQEYTLHVVFWETAKRTTENGTTKRVAVNKTHRTFAVTLGTGYDTANITFPSHFDEKKQATLWLSQGGNRIEGARWLTQHRSDPGGRKVDIATKTDVWTYTAKNAVIPGIIGVIIGLGLAYGTLKRTGTGPRLGVGIWAFAGAIGLFSLAAMAYFQTAVILANAPWVMGLVVGVVAYGGGLLFANDVHRIGFERLELKKAKPLRNLEPDADRRPDEDPLADGGTAEADWVAPDQYKEELYRDLVEKPAVRGEDGFKIPVRGIRPFLARLFADAATLDMSSFRTRNVVESGRLDEVIAVDPRSEDPVFHESARIRRALPWDELPRDEDTGELQTDWRGQLVAGAMTLAILVLPVSLGWYAADQALGVPSIGAGLGLLVTAVASYTAEDGIIEFDEAPIHYNQVRATATFLQTGYKDAQDLEDAEEQAWDERAKSKTEARDAIERERRVVTDRALDSLLGDDGATKTDIDAETNGATPEPGDDEEVSDGDE